MARLPVTDAWRANARDALARKGWTQAEFSRLLSKHVGKLVAPPQVHRLLGKGDAYNTSELVEPASELLGIDGPATVLAPDEKALMDAYRRLSGPDDRALAREMVDAIVAGLLRRKR